MKKIVYIGGGGGVSNITPALKDHHEVTAIVTTFDDGGSYGYFRKEYKNPLTGDIRRAFAALSTNSLGEITEHRFREGFLGGHTVGNVLLSAVHGGNTTPEEAMNYLHKIFEVKGKVIGVSYDLAELQAQLKDRSIIRGEHKLDNAHDKSHIRIDRVWLEPEPKLADGVHQSIIEADLIIMGPGDLYTSTIPSLLVEGVSQAINESQAILVYFCNRFTKWGQTNEFTVSDHVRNIEKYIPRRIRHLVISSSDLPQVIIDKHAEEKETLVEYDLEGLKSNGYDVHIEDLHECEEVESCSSDRVKRAKVRYKSDAVLAVVNQILGH